MPSEAMRFVTDYSVSAASVARVGFDRLYALVRQQPAAIDGDSKRELSNPSPFRPSRK